MLTADRRRKAFRPICVAEWDIVGPVPAILLNEAGDYRGGPVHLLVRLGTEPLGYADFEFEHIDSLSTAAATAAWESFGSEVNARLTKSGLPTINGISADGLQLDPNQLAFLAEREHLLKNAPDISVVICTRDRPTRIADCVRELARQEYPSYEIVVVDNAPADPAAVPLVLESLDARVPLRYILEARGGLSWARNAGWLAAKADIIAFLDDDEVPDRHWLAEIVRGFAVKSKVGCVTGIALPAELKTEPQHWFEGLGGFRQGRGFNQEIFGLGHPQSPLYPFPPFGAGANMAFRREVLVDIGGFNVSLGAGTPARASEDTFAFTRTLIAHHTMVYQPTALVFHYHRGTLADLRKQLHGYSVGTIAFYTALIAWRPKVLLAVLRLIPSAIRDNMPGKNPTRTATMRTSPASLVLTQILGMLKGVPAYAISVMKQRRIAEMS
jgi:glycosyltransferase involved in cell wall biosynthesis